MVQGPTPAITKSLLLLTLNRPGDVCRFMKMGKSDFEKLLNEPVYRSFYIPKKRNGKRKLEAPSGLLKKKQRWLNHHLQAYYLQVKSNAAHGFVALPKGENQRANVVQNALPHVGKRHLLNIDLKDFFQNISGKRVYELFKGPYFQFSDQVAIALSLLSTYQGHLPTGAPSSPVLSNWVCLELDQALEVHCACLGMTYTRYADDLTFSRDVPFSRAEVEALVALIEQHDFKINRRKMRLTGPNRQQQVTGVVVNERLSIDRRQLKKIRAMLHDAEKSGLEKATDRHLGKSGSALVQQQHFVAKLQGNVAWVGQVRGKNDPMYLRFAASLTVLKQRLKELEAAGYLPFDARADRWD
ncbi:MAG: reverse transcriptase family protein [Sphingobacteriaceae bacterium]|nr:reverse transcriptase family protein [Sphingobacteriaceae bacterium]